MEQKLFGSHLLARNIKKFDVAHLKSFGKLFDHVTDWATCDTLCGKVFAEMIKIDHKKNKKKVKL